MLIDNNLEQLKIMVKSFKYDYKTREDSIKNKEYIAGTLYSSNISKFNELCEDIEYEKLLLSDIGKSIKKFTILIKHIEFVKIFGDGEILRENRNELTNNDIYEVLGV